MNICNISSFLILTLGAMVGFYHGIDALDWGIDTSFHLWTHLIPSFLFRVLQHRNRIRSIRFCENLKRCKTIDYRRSTDSNPKNFSRSRMTTWFMPLNSSRKI